MTVTCSFDGVTSAGDLGIHARVRTTIPYIS
jgi:hypothetical protein